MAYDGEIKLRATLDPSGVKQSARNLSKTISDIFDAASGKEMNIQFQKAQASMEKLDMSARKLLNRMEELEKTKIPTQEYNEISSFLEKAQAQYNKLLEKQEKYLDAGGKKNTSSYRRMEADLAELDNTIEYSKAELKDLVDSGKAFKLGSDTEEYQKLTEQLGDVNNKMRIATETAMQNEMFHEETVQTVEQETEEVKKLDKATKQASKSAHGLNLNFKTILKYAFGIRSLYVLFRKLRSAAKEGLQVMAQQDSGLNQRLSALLTTVKQLKADIATIIEPFVTTLTPALTVLLDKLHAVAMGFAQFFAALVGQNYIEVATVQAMDYAKSLDAVANSTDKALGSYDKLNVISSGNDQKNTLKLTKDTVQYTKQALDNDSWTVKLGKRLHEIFVTAKEAIETLWERLNETTWFPALLEKLKEILNNPDALLISIGILGVGKSLGKLLFRGVQDSGLGANILSLIPTTLTVTVTAVLGYKLGNKIFESLPEAVQESLGEAVAGYVGAYTDDGIKGIAQKWKENLVDAVNTLLGKDLEQPEKPPGIYQIEESTAEAVVNGYKEAYEQGGVRGVLEKALENYSDAFWDIVSGGKESNQSMMDWYLLGAPAGGGTIKAPGANYDPSKGDWTNQLKDPKNVRTVAQDFATLVRKAMQRSGRFFKQAGEDMQEEFRDGFLAPSAISGTASAVDEEFGKIINDQRGELFYKAGTKYGTDLNKGIQNSASDSAPKTTSAINQSLLSIRNGLNALGFGESGAEISNLLYTGIAETAEADTAPTKTLLVDSMNSIRTALGENDFSETGTKLGNSLFEGLESSISGTVESATGSFKSLVEQVKDVFGDTAIQSVVTAGNNKLGDIENVGKSVGNSLVSGIKGVIGSNTSLAKTFQELLKKMFKKTYELKFSNVIEGITSTFSSMFSISATVPGLAKGAVIPANKQFLAMLGDQTHGTNIEAPLDTIVEAMQTALNNGGGAQSVNIYLDGHQISQVVWDNMEKRYKQTGRPVFG